MEDKNRLDFVVSLVLEPENDLEATLKLVDVVFDSRKEDAKESVRKYFANLVEVVAPTELTPEETDANNNA